MSVSRKRKEPAGHAPFADVLVFRIVQGFGVAFRILSLRQARFAARIVGDFFHRLVKLRCGVVYGNLSLAFPDKSIKEIRAIAAGVYRNVATTLIYTLRFPLIKSQSDVLALVDLDSSAFLRGTDNGRRGAVMVSAHYGNWELMALAFGMLVKPMTIIVKRLSNAMLDRGINELRTSKGNGIIYDSHSVREGLRLLAGGGVLSMLGDQSDPSSSSSFGEFLGRRASMFQGAAFFALKANVPLFVGMCRWGNGGKYIVETHEVETADLTFCKEDIAILATRYTQVIETYVRQWPEEWFWLHNRWKNGS